MKLSTIIIFTIFIVLVGVFLEIEKVKRDIEYKNTATSKATFNYIQRVLNDVFVNTMYKYQKEKDILRQKHKKVLEILKHNKNMNFQKLLKQIDNKNHQYNIYLTDNNLTIIKSTYKNDIGFNLSFAKDEFLSHRKQNIIGVSSPVFKQDVGRYFVFSDSFLPNSNELLQLSYTFMGYEKDLQSIKLKHLYNLKKIRVFIYHPQNKKTYEFYRLDIGTNLKIDEFLKIFEEGRSLLKFPENRLIIQKSNGNYKRYIFIKKSPISDEKIIYELVFDESVFLDELDYYKKIEKIFLFVIVSLILLVLVIKKRERRIDLNRDFIKAQAHEIKTPLNIIAINSDIYFLNSQISQML